MRIAFVSDAYVPVPTGVAVSMLTLRRSLEKLGHTVYVLAPAYRGWKESDPKVARLPAIFRPFEKYTPWRWPTSSVSRQTIQNLKLDIVHGHFLFSFPSFPAKLARTAKAPLIQTFYRIFPEYAKYHLGFLQSPQASFQKATIQTINFFNQADLVIALSRMSKRYLQGLGLAAPIEILPVGIFPKDFASLPPEAVREKFRIPAGAKVILSVVHLDEEDNLIFLLRTLKRVLKAIDEAYLIIVGDGNKSRAYREVIASQPFGKYVKLTNYLPKAQLNRLYGACDLFVYPGRLDPQPLVIIEALAAGTPAVAVKGFGAQDFINDNKDGYITGFNLEDFSDKIIELLRRDKMRLEFSQAARSNARRFAANNAAKGLLDLYQTALENSRNSLNKWKS